LPKGAKCLADVLTPRRMPINKQYGNILLWRSLSFT
jgi:hypothetical protein